MKLHVQCIKTVIFAESLIAIFDEEFDAGWTVVPLYARTAL